MMKLFPYLMTAVICSTAANVQAKETVDITLGQELYAEQYKEYINNQTAMQERAPMIGFFGNVRIPFATNHHIDLSGRVAYGVTHYKGQDNSDDDAQFGTLTYSGTDRFVAQLGAQYGYTFEFAKITPTIGIGYRHLTDRSDQTDQGGYRRDANYYYTSVGISAVFPVMNTWELSPQFTYHYLIKGKQYSHLESYLDGITPVNNQHHGHGIEMALALTHTFAHSDSSLSIMPFYRYWHIGRSDEFNIPQDPTNALVEPENKTHELGMRVQYIF